MRSMEEAGVKLQGLRWGMGKGPKDSSTATHTSSDAKCKYYYSKRITLKCVGLGDSHSPYGEKKEKKSPDIVARLNNELVVSSNSFLTIFLMDGTICHIPPQAPPRYSIAYCSITCIKSTLRVWSHLETQLRFLTA